MFRGGVRSVTKTLADGKEHPLYYKARTPTEVAACRGAIASFTSDEAGYIARDKYLGKFLANSMCNEDGSPLFTLDEAMQVPDNLKVELCLLIVEGSNEVGDAGKD